MLGIAHLADRRRAGLSGGEAQRVSIARALAVDPAVVFLDEPMASLDPPTRRALLADLEAIFRRLSTAVLWVTHDTEEALAVADTGHVPCGRPRRAGGPRAPPSSTARPPRSWPTTSGVDVWLEGTVTLDERGVRLVLPDGAALRLRRGRTGSRRGLHPPGRRHALPGAA